jgi:hypothetical protein
VYIFPHSWLFIYRFIPKPNGAWVAHSYFPRRGA